LWLFPVTSSNLRDVYKTSCRADIEGLPLHMMHLVINQT
jgi:hypothetical protein